MTPMKSGVTTRRRMTGSSSGTAARQVRRGRSRCLAISGSRRAAVAGVSVQDEWVSLAGRPPHDVQITLGNPGVDPILDLAFQPRRGATELHRLGERAVGYLPVDPRTTHARSLQHVAKPQKLRVSGWKLAARDGQFPMGRRRMCGFHARELVARGNGKQVVGEAGLGTLREVGPAHQRSRRHNKGCPPDPRCVSQTMSSR